MQITKYRIVDDFPIAYFESKCETLLHAGWTPGDLKVVLTKADGLAPQMRYIKEFYFYETKNNTTNKNGAPGTNSEGINQKSEAASEKGS